MTITEQLNQFDHELKDTVKLPPPLRRQWNDIRTGVQSMAQSITQLNSLMHVAAVMNSSLHLANVLEAVMDTVIDVLHAERGYIMLNEPNGLTIRAARNWDGDSLPEKDVVFSSRAIEMAMQTLQPMVTLNAMQDTRFEGSKSVMANDLRSILCVPLQLHGKMIGVLYADSRVSSSGFSEDILPLMNAFANQVAIAIANARHFEQIKSDLEKAQREVSRLRIEIDRTKIDEEVKAITESDYFQYLEGMVVELRDEFNGT
ncbi:MAG: hypothetical protein OHK0046_42750 [Anaerolineae bacterium]